MIANIVGAEKRNSVTVAAGGLNYQVGIFCLAKTIILFRYLSELAGAAGISEIVRGLESKNDGAPRKGLISLLIDSLPSALATSSPKLYAVLGLLVTPNSRLAEIEARNEDLEEILTAQGATIANSATLEETVELVQAAIEMVGVKSIIQSAPKLLALARAGANKDQ